MSSTAAHDRFFYGTAAIDCADDSAALTTAFTAALAKAKDGLAYAPTSVCVYRSGKGVSESEMRGAYCLLRFLRSSKWFVRLWPECGRCCRCR